LSQFITALSSITYQRYLVLVYKSRLSFAAAFSTHPVPLYPPGLQPFIDWPSEYSA
jgi:hypothetical protein